MIHNLKYTIFIIVLWSLAPAKAQSTSSLIISGNTFERIDKFSKTNKLKENKYEIVNLDGVTLEVIKDGTVIQKVVSDINGNFKLNFDFKKNQILDIRYTKKGFYSKLTRIKTLDCEIGYDYILDNWNIAVRKMIVGVDEPPLVPFELYYFDKDEKNFIIDYDYQIEYQDVQEKIYSRIEEEVKFNEAFANLRQSSLDELNKELQIRESEAQDRINRMNEQSRMILQNSREEAEKMKERVRDSLIEVYSLTSYNNDRTESKTKVQYIYVDSSKTTIKSEQKFSRMKATDITTTLNDDDVNRAGIQIIRRRDEIFEAKRQLELDKLLAKTQEDSLLIHQRELAILDAENEMNKFALRVKEANKQLELQNLKIDNQRQLLYALGIFVAFLIGFFVVVYRLYNQKRKINLLLESKNAEIEEINQDILASIRYAERIQSAILPPMAFFDERIKGEYFVLFKPKDIVSGDFYWAAEKDNKLIISAIDCTGHGVPGAFMSMIGYNILNKVINEMGITEPDKILFYQNKFVSEALRKDSNPKIRDGMDMALITIDYQNMILEYAGAYNPLYFVRNGEMHHTKSTSLAIGTYFQYPERREEYEKHTVKLQKGDTAYIFTDGYADQFGGPEFKKFMYKSLRDLLLEINNEPLSKQSEIIWQKHLKWRGEHEQIDDICLIGIKF